MNLEDLKDSWDKVIFYLTIVVSFSRWLQGGKMELGKDVSLDIVSGKLVLVGKVAGGDISLSVDLAAMAMPVLDGLKAQIESGAIDPVKGTDLDKEAMLKVLQALKDALVK